MLQIYNDKHIKIAGIEDPEDLKIEKTLSSGDKQITFSYPKKGAEIDSLLLEYYIRTKTDEYVIKEMGTGAEKNDYVAQLNIEELQDQKFLYGFESNTQTMRACLEFAIDGTGWTVGICEVGKRRTVSIDCTCTAWDVLQEALKTYRCETKIDSINKIIDIYETIGQDRGAYFVEGLNLRKLTLKADTYNFYTRIYPVGKDGITPQTVLGVPYIDNNQYTDKIVPLYWKDERYTITENLIEDATAKLEMASKPYSAYSADVADLAAQKAEYSILEYDIGDEVTLISKTEGVKEKQRIVKLTDYPAHPEKNSCELSNTKKSFAQMQQETEEKAQSDAVDQATAHTKKVLNAGYWTIDQVQTAITSSESGIMTSVNQFRTEQRDLTYAAEQEAKDYAAEINEKTIERMTNEYSTSLKQTANSFNMSVNSVEETVAAQGAEMEEFRKENETYFHYADNGLEIGKKEDGGLLPFSTLLSDQKLEFRQDGVPVAFVQYNKLHIENVEAVRRWSVGAASDGGYFDFISTQYGMGVKWREAEQRIESNARIATVRFASRQRKYKQIIDDNDGVFEVVK